MLTNFETKEDIGSIKTKINQFYNLTSNTDLKPYKNLSEYIKLPDNIMDSQFNWIKNKLNSKNITEKKDMTDYLVLEQFIKQYIHSNNDLEKFYSELKHFTENYLKRNNYLESLYINNRKLFRVKIIKYFKLLNYNRSTIHVPNINKYEHKLSYESATAKFFDLNTYFIINWQDFLNITDKMIKHIERFYI